MTKFVGLREKIYSYLIDDSSKDKKAKGTRKCVIKKTNLNLKIIKLFKTNVDSLKKIIKKA